MPIAESVRLGQDVKIFHPTLVNLYGCTVGDDTRIGAFVEIQKNATVGARCKISSHTFICEGVVIEDEVFVGHGVMFTNDRFPAGHEPGRQPADRGRLDGRADDRPARRPRSAPTRPSWPASPSGSARWSAPARWSPSPCPTTRSWPAFRPASSATRESGNCAQLRCRKTSDNSSRESPSNLLVQEARP